MGVSGNGRILLPLINAATEICLNVKCVFGFLLLGMTRCCGPVTRNWSLAILCDIYSLSGLY